MKKNSFTLKICAPEFELNCYKGGLVSRCYCSHYNLHTYWSHQMMDQTSHFPSHHHLYLYLIRFQTDLKEGGENITFCTRKKHTWNKLQVIKKYDEPFLFPFWSDSNLICSNSFWRFNSSFVGLVSFLLSLGFLIFFIKSFLLFLSCERRNPCQLKLT